MKKYQSRYLDKYLKKELRNKILILTGPRQSGKNHVVQASVRF